jgi:Sec63 Brl domain
VLEEGDGVEALPMGRIASFYYLKHKTMAFFRKHLNANMDAEVGTFFGGLLRCFCLRCGARLRHPWHAAGLHLVGPLLELSMLRLAVAGVIGQCLCLTALFPPPLLTPWAQAVLTCLCGAAEYDELPVRHNEDKYNADLSAQVGLRSFVLGLGHPQELRSVLLRSWSSTLHFSMHCDVCVLRAPQVRWPINVRHADDPHCKASLLLQAHLGGVALPISDYVTDTKTVLDNSLRVLQAMIEIAAEARWLDTALTAMALVQALMQVGGVDKQA